MSRSGQGGRDAEEVTLREMYAAEASKAAERAKEPTPSAAAILKAGLCHMEDRATTYDKPGGERSMGATVEAFQSITGHKLTEEQGWLFMVLLKAVRSQQGNYKPDNYEDGAAYFGLMGEAAGNREVMQ